MAGAAGLETEFVLGFDPAAPTTAVAGDLAEPVVSGGPPARLTQTCDRGCTDSMIGTDHLLTPSANAPAPLRGMKHDESCSAN